MKRLFICTAVALLVGCSSPPKLIEPTGRVTPVYELQHEMNERHGGATND